jgi:hypothetical protein
MTTFIEVPRQHAHVNRQTEICKAKKRSVPEHESYALEDHKMYTVKCPKFANGL